MNPYITSKDGITQKMLLMPDGDGKSLTKLRYSDNNSILLGYHEVPLKWNKEDKTKMSKKEINFWANVLFTVMAMAFVLGVAVGYFS